MKLLKNKIFWGFVVSSIGVILGYIFLYPVQFHLCTADFTTMTFDNSCLASSSLIGIKLFYPFLALIPIFLILFFIPRAVSAWKKFAVWYIPIVGIFVALSSPGDAGWIIGPTYSQYVQGLGAIYLGSSLSIIGMALMNEQRKRKGKSPLGTLWYWLAAIILSIPALYLFNPLATLILSGLAAV